MVNEENENEENENNENNENTRKRLCANCENYYINEICNTSCGTCGFSNKNNIGFSIVEASLYQFQGRNTSEISMWQSYEKYKLLLQGEVFQQPDSSYFKMIVDKCPPLENTPISYRVETIINIIYSLEDIVIVKGPRGRPKRGSIPVKKELYNKRDLVKILPYLINLVEECQGIKKTNFKFTELESYNIYQAYRYCLYLLRRENKTQTINHKYIFYKIFQLFESLKWRTVFIYPRGYGALQIVGAWDKLDMDKLLSRKIHTIASLPPDTCYFSYWYSNYDSSSTLFTSFTPQPSK